jgi:hypothetical protein
VDAEGREDLEHLSGQLHELRDNRSFMQHSL